MIISSTEEFVVGVGVAGEFVAGAAPVIWAAAAASCAASDVSAPCKRIPKAIVAAIKQKKTEAVRVMEDIPL
jgi:hypothetical protein